VELIKENEEVVYTGKELSILDTAERLFAKSGFEGTSVRDIAREAGVNVAMISYYFGSKDKLLEAIVTARISASRLVLEYLLKDQSLEPLQKIEILVDRMVDRMMSNKSLHRIMMRAQLDTEHEAVSACITSMKEKNLDLVNKLVHEGQRKKVFVKGIDVPLMMMTLIGTIYQAAAGSNYLKASLRGETGDAAEQDAILIKKLKAHLKHVLKATLTYETK